MAGTTAAQLETNHFCHLSSEVLILCNFFSLSGGEWAPARFDWIQTAGKDAICSDLLTVNGMLRAELISKMVFSGLKKGGDWMEFPTGSWGPNTHTCL